MALGAFESFDEDATMEFPAIDREGIEEDIVLKENEIKYNIPTPKKILGTVEHTLETLFNSHERMMSLLNQLEVDDDLMASEKEYIKDSLTKDNLSNGIAIVRQCLKVMSQRIDMQFPENREDQLLEVQNDIDNLRDLKRRLTTRVGYVLPFSILRTIGIVGVELENEKKRILSDSQFQKQIMIKSRLSKLEA
ncbi:hypothetical protein KC678_03000 [Candidatus Dojkabacteria bacterium]|uniref:Uncharacterized protein n=1 Tax=Candidatus Dojkabacteria bacterium TaxID=2099670 RepID=A0A955IAU9_9BACT|nr:hypothetical protein [Candidatus Dojkabacteria bacterium]